MVYFCNPTRPLFNCAYSVVRSGYDYTVVVPSSGVVLAMATPNRSPFVGRCYYPPLRTEKRMLSMLFSVTIPVTPPTCGTHYFPSAGGVTVSGSYSAENQGKGSGEGVYKAGKIKKNSNSNYNNILFLALAFSVCDS